ncbi:MAG: manganese-dependent inorganic pyrophosphatase, partial [Candidatus Magasanikbacteria bacterium]|nr:manganese-dependent inorganic pyrophosphatase [Candidatus Magasanikbacteria bacterium]
MSEKIYIIGHKSPDTDSVVSAISYASLKNKLEETDIYIPVVAGEINQATSFVLEKFGFEKPEVLKDATDKTLILVDHNEASQIVDGAENAGIIEIVDHHKFNFTCNEPIMITTRPWGSTISIITGMYMDNEMEIEKEMAGLMLAAILDDTVITKSPTCTEVDEELIEKLAELAGVSDWKALGMEIFKAKANVSSLGEMEIIKNDFKDFNYKAGKFGIGQVETVDLNDFKDREEKLLAEMKKMQTEENYHSVILFITDIINEGSQFLIVTSDEATMEKALGGKIV